MNAPKELTTVVFRLVGDYYEYTGEHAVAMATALHFPANIHGLKVDNVGFLEWETALYVPALKAAGFCPVFLDTDVPFLNKGVPS